MQLQKVIKNMLKKFRLKIMTSEAVRGHFFFLFIVEGHRDSLMRLIEAILIFWLKVTSEVIEAIRDYSRPLEAIKGYLRPNTTCL